MADTANPIIVFHYCPGETTFEAKLLAANLTQWIGKFKDYPLWIFEQSEIQNKEKAINLPQNFEKFTIEVPDELLRFPFAGKVYLAAEAEKLAELNHRSELIWLDPDNLFIQDPTELTLLPGEKIAISPVHLRNISSLADEPMDEFWKLVYAHCQVSEEHIFQITSIADQIQIRAHFNAGLISVDPRVGIMRHWKENFLTLHQDAKIQTFYNKDIRYKIFIHQAVLSATILALCNREEIKLLPPTYNFPLHLVNGISPQNRPACLEQLVTVRYDQFDEPGWSTALPVGEPFETWLKNAIRLASKG